MKDLKDYPSDLFNIRDEPDLAIETSLAEVCPSITKNPSGYWSLEIINEFKKIFDNGAAVVKVRILILLYDC